MDKLKASIKQLSSTARVLSQILSKLNREKKDTHLKEATINADRVFDAGRKLDSALKPYRSMHSISKADFKSKLEDLFRQVFSFLDGAKLHMGKYTGQDLAEASRMMFLATKEANDVLKGVTILNNIMKSSRV